MNGRNKEKGNIITALLGGVVVLGMLGFGTYQLISGPLSSAARVTQDTQVKHNLMTAGRLAIMDAAQQPQSGDCDADGYTEPRPYRATTAGKPTGGGLIPDDMGIPVKDPWGMDYGYCVWDVGTLSGQAGCGGTTGRLDGADDPRTGAAHSLTVFALISAGPDRTFETACSAYVNDTTDVITSGGDDIVQRFTYTEAASATSFLWSLKPGDPNTATINKDLEIGNDISFDASLGAIDALALNAMGQIHAGGGLELPDQTELTDCGTMTSGTLRYNTGSEKIEFCSGTGGWTAITGGSDGWPLQAPDGSASAPSYSFTSMPDGGLYMNSEGNPEIRVPTGKSISLQDSFTFSDTDITLDSTDIQLGTLFSNKVLFGHKDGNADFRVVSDGGIQIQDTSGGCDAALAGAIKFDTSNLYRFCNGENWVDFTPPGAPPSAPPAGITLNCNDYNSSTGLDLILNEPSLTFTYYFPGGRRAFFLGENYAVIGSTAFAGNQPYITACVSGTGNPKMDYGNHLLSSFSETGNSAPQLALFPKSASPILHLDIPSTSGTSINGNITFGMAADIDYNITYQQPGSYIFVTSTTYNGNLGGLAGADAKCQARADASTLLPDGLTFKAILSDGTTNARDRITVNYPVVNTNGDIVSSADIWTSNPTVGRYNENGGSAFPGYSWTGSNNDGTKHTDTCNNWTSGASGVYGAYGMANSGSYWLKWSASFLCNNSGSQALYCISQ